MRHIKTMLAALVVTAWGVSAFAVPTLVIQDAGGINAISTSASGVVIASSSDGFWTIVVTTGIASPPASGQGTLASPTMDLAISATSANGSENNPLRIYFAADGYGPSSGSWSATMTGHLVSGAAAPVVFNTYYDTANGLSSLATPLPAGSTLLTTSGTLPGPDYGTVQGSGALNLASPYSLIELVTINGGRLGASYSLDASLITVPDGGTTAILLGGVLSVLGLIRRKLV